MPATLLILAFFAVLVTIMVLMMHRYRQATDGTPDEVRRCTVGGGCCGGSNCHRQRSLSETVDKPTYFEDEELDSYIGRKPDEYTESEVAEWREVVTTLRASEVVEWVTSIHKRRLHIPEVLRSLVTERLRETRCTA